MFDSWYYSAEVMDRIREESEFRDRNREGQTIHVNSFLRIHLIPTLAQYMIGQARPFGIKFLKTTVKGTSLVASG